MTGGRLWPPRGLPRRRESARSLPSKNKAARSEIRQFPHALTFAMRKSTFAFRISSIQELCELGAVRPTQTLSVVAALGPREWLVALEAAAAKEFL